MATYYWVGGAGTWNRTLTTNWSLTSGGAGGAGVPTSTDNVIIDNNSGTSGQAITLPDVYASALAAVCNDLTVTNTNFMYLGNTSGNHFLDVHGSLSFPTSGNFTPSNFYLTFRATTPGKTIDPGKSLNPGTFLFEFDGVGGEWTLQRNLSLQGTLRVTAGSVITNNYTITANGLNQSSTSVCSLNLGASTVNVGQLEFGTTARPDFTFTAGTSTINITGSSSTFTGNGKTFYNVSWTSTTTDTNGSNIRGTNTFNNLTILPFASAGLKRFYIWDSQTINGTLNVTGVGATRRVVLVAKGNDPGILTGGITQYTLTAAAVSLTDVDFVGFSAAGAATWSGTRIGNGGNNTGFTFDTPKTVYWSRDTGGNYLTSNPWATTSGGTPDVLNFPLGQDTAIIENTGLNSSASISIPSFLVIGNLDCSTRAFKSATISLSSTSSIAFVSGNWTINNQITINSGILVITGSVTFQSSSFAQPSVSSYFNVKNSLTLAAESINFTASPASGSYQVSSTGTLTLSVATAFINTGLSVYGTLNLNSNRLTANRITLQSNGTTNFGTGDFRITGGTNNGFTCNTTHIVTGSKTVNIAVAASVSLNSPTESNALNVNLTGSDAIFFDGGRINNLNCTGYSGTLGNASITVFGNYTLSATMTLTAGTNTTTFASTSGTQTITTNGRTLDFPVVIDGVGGTIQLAGPLTMGTTRTLTLTNGTFNANNQNVTVGFFSSSNSNTRTLNMGSGTWTISGTGSVWNIATSTNLTLNPSTSTIVLSDTSTAARTFAGGGRTYNNLTIGGTTGTSTLTFTGSNTFNTLSSTKTVAHTILFTASTTNTFTTFNVNGTAGNIVTLGSVTSASHTLAKSGTGTVTVNYLSISRSTATPTLTWAALNSTNGGNNVGWYFGGFPSPSNFFLLF